VSPVKYEVDLYNPEGDTLHSHCRGNDKSYKTGESRDTKMMILAYHIF
jgi:hypothetical protein